MPITATCPSCGRKKPMPDHFRWRRLRCPKCRAEFILKPEPVPVGAREEFDFAGDPLPVRRPSRIHGAVAPAANPPRLMGIILLCVGLAAASWFLVDQFTNPMSPSDRREHRDVP